MHYSTLCIIGTDTKSLSLMLGISQLFRTISEQGSTTSSDNFETLIIPKRLLLHGVVNSSLTVVNFLHLTVLSLKSIDLIIMKASLRKTKQLLPGLHSKHGTFLSETVGFSGSNCRSKILLLNS
jgi:hypothetical protein